MAELKVNDITVPALLEKLLKREWLIPKFQREFVWTTSDVIDLVLSIFDTRPIGMATLWEQPDQQALPLEPLSIPDDPGTDGLGVTYFASTTETPRKVFAVLDGKQRCTAIAMAFGGFRSHNGKFRFSGRYFLNVATRDPKERVVYKRDTEVTKENLHTDAACIARGLFPLASTQNGESILSQWMRYLQAVQNPAFYPDGKLPNQAELKRRDEILKKAFEGVVQTKLAVYTVPDNYNLAEICEIFEKLNTTGTKVSTVDLIHSWLYAETAGEPAGPILLRDWLDELGQRDGAIGWSSSTDRPELIAQFVTACYVALEQKSPPRPIGGVGSAGVTSVKAADLLATPTKHWQMVIQNGDRLANIIGDFQRVVAGGFFPYSACPYPISAAAYIALRWHAEFDDKSKRTWGIAELDALFRAFFWRNALMRRYDQGFLTQIGTDIRELRECLRSRNPAESIGVWTEKAESSLDSLLTRFLPSEDELYSAVTEGRLTGALQKAMTLSMIANASQDFLNPSISLAFPYKEVVELHHIYPRGWCSKNRAGDLAKVLDPAQADRDWVNSIANIMPLSRQSNNVWKDKVPGQAIEEKGMKFDNVKKCLVPAFIDEEGFGLLKKGGTGIPAFWERRAQHIVNDLISRTRITF